LYIDLTSFSFWNCLLFLYFLIRVRVRVSR